MTIVVAGGVPVPYKVPGLPEKLLGIVGNVTVTSTDLT